MILQNTIRRRASVLGVLAIGSVILTACSSATMTLSPAGPVVTKAQGGPAKAFENAEKTARDNPAVDADAKSMYLLGSTLIYANCNAFFDRASRDQTRLEFARDTTGVITAVTASVFAITSAHKTALAVLGIGSTAAYSGMDLVAKDYLFSADNVEAVRTLVDNALSTHNTAVLALAKDRTYSYDFAAKQLFDEQAICTMQSISALARDAIKNGHLTATSNTLDTDESKIAEMQDGLVLQSLGVLFQTPGPLSASQAGALWWYIKDQPTPTDTAVIAGLLQSLPSATSPLDTNKQPIAGWTLGVAVTDVLNRFSAGTIAQFERQIAQARSPGAGFVGPATPAFTLAASGPAAANDRIEVRVK